jgi:hypothetical protein
MIAAVVDEVTAQVVNIIVADADSDVSYPGTFLVNVTDAFCGIGWAYDSVSGSFNNPELPQ